MAQRKYTQYWERYIGQSRKWVAVLVFDYGYPEISKIEFSMAGIARRFAAGQSIPRWITPRATVAPIDDLNYWFGAKAI